MKNVWLLIVVFALVAGGRSARAEEMDYRCLKLCAGQGKTYYACKPQCTFGAPSAAPSSQVIVDAPKPVEELLSGVQAPASQDAGIGAARGLECRIYCREHDSAHDDDDGDDRV